MEKEIPNMQSPRSRLSGDISMLIMCDHVCHYVVVYSYFLYHNKQTSAKTWWVFKVIVPSQQDGIYIYKIKSNNSSEI